jgi:hypothetical protein
MNPSPALDPVTVAAADPADDRLLTTKQVCTRWHTTPLMLLRMRNAGRIRAVTLGKRSNRYRLSDVLAFEQGLPAA